MRAHVPVLSSNVTDSSCTEQALVVPLGLQMTDTAASMSSAQGPSCTAAALGPVQR